MVKVVSVVWQGMGCDLKLNQWLCELLGYDGSFVFVMIIGSDLIKGYCGILLDMDLLWLSFVCLVVNCSVEDFGLLVVKVEIVIVGLVCCIVVLFVVVVFVVFVVCVQMLKFKFVFVLVVLLVGMILFGVCYVQIGIYVNVGNVDCVVECVWCLGYLVLCGWDWVCGVEVQIIMVGFFDSCEVIVCVLDGLWCGGFCDVYLCQFVFFRFVIGCRFFEVWFSCVCLVLVVVWWCDRGWF